MYALATNSPIQGFPETTPVLSTMLSKDLNRILAELEMDTSGDVSEKRERLRAYIGLTTKAM